MKRRVFLSGSVAVGVTTLSPSLISLAAEKKPVPGTINTIAGAGPAGFSGDGGPATQARLDYPIGVVVDAAGVVYIADAMNNRVRKVSPSGTITTVIGTGAPGFSGDGGPATQARLDRALWLALDHPDDGLGPDERVLELFGAAAPGLLAGAPFPTPQ